jgi:hypothetical protein
MMQAEAAPQPQTTQAAPQTTQRTVSVTCPSLGQVGWKGVIFGIVNLGVLISSILSCFGKELGIAVFDLAVWVN